jgi:hypothetical protein
MIWSEGLDVWVNMQVEVEIDKGVAVEKGM